MINLKKIFFGESKFILEFDDNKFSDIIIYFFTQHKDSNISFT